MPLSKFEQNMLTVLPLAALTIIEHYLDSQPQRRQESSGIIDLVTQI